MCHLNHYFFINRSRRIEKIYIYTCYLLANPPHKLLPTVEERRKQETIRKQPCQRTGKTGSRKSEDRYKDQTDQCAGNHLKYTGKYSKAGKAHSLDKKTNNIDQRQKHIKAGVGDQKLSGLCDNLCDIGTVRRSYKQIDQWTCKENDDNKDRCGVNCGKNDGGFHTACQTIIFSGTHVLSTVSCHRRTECVKWAHHKHRNTAAGRHGCHGTGT